MELGEPEYKGSTTDVFWSTASWLTFLRLEHQQQKTTVMIMATRRTPPPPATAPITTGEIDVDGAWVGGAWHGGEQEHTRSSNEMLLVSFDMHKGLGGVALGHVFKVEG